MCNCISYNRPEKGQTDGEVILHNKEMTGKDSVCIDFCIVDDIKKLWSNNIPTLNSCCGHNESPKSVVVDKCYSDRAKEMLPHFDVFFWDLIKK